MDGAGSNETALWVPINDRVSSRVVRADNDHGAKLKWSSVEYIQDCASFIGCDRTVGYHRRL